MFFIDKHNEFEAVAAKIGIKGRDIAKTKRGVEQHVVFLRSNGGLLRWPTWYKLGRAPVVR